MYIFQYIFNQNHFFRVSDNGSDCILGFRLYIGSNPPCDHVLYGLVSLNVHRLCDPVSGVYLWRIKEPNLGV